MDTPVVADQQKHLYAEMLDVTDKCHVLFY